MRAAYICIIAITLVSCAKRPESIEPVAMPADSYATLDCSMLTADLVRERQWLADLIKKQNETVAGDTIGVLMIGVPTASATGGDQETAIAIAKGKVNALESAVVRRGC